MGSHLSKSERRTRVKNSNLLSSPVLSDGHTSLNPLVNVSQEGSDFKLLLRGNGATSSKRGHQTFHMSPHPHLSSANQQNRILAHRLLAQKNNNSIQQEQQQQQQNLVDLDDHPMLMFDNNQVNNPLSSNIPQQFSNVKTLIDSDFKNSESNNATRTKLYVALYDYEGINVDDLDFKKGDHLEVIDGSNDKDWLLARPLRKNSRKEQGYIPRNYVQELKSIQDEVWYFGNIKRKDAEKKLLRPDNDIGSFLVRDSESRENDYSLSVRDFSSKEGKDDNKPIFVASVKHYRIRTSEQGGYFIAQKNVFATIQALVAHYSFKPDGLCTVLKEPCTRSEKHAPVLSYDQWEIDRKHLTFGKELGHGQFGQVFQGLIMGRDRVAIKTLKKGSMDPQDFLAEAQIMKGLEHKHLVKLYAVCTKEEPIFIITELMTNGALLEYLQKEEGRRLDIRTKIEMSAQIASGMKYLEERNYVHRDLAARNILVGENNICKIADFGLARLIKDSEYEARAGGRFPIKWTAPEAANYSRFSIKSDVWSFGIVLYEIISNGKLPYPSMTNAEVLTQIENGYRMPKLSNCPDKLYEIMQLCWHKDSNKRPTFDALSWQLEEFFEQDTTEYREANQYRAKS